MVTKTLTEMTFLYTRRGSGLLMNDIDRQSELPLRIYMDSKFALEPDWSELFCVLHTQKYFNHWETGISLLTFEGQGRPVVQTRRLQGTKICELLRLAPVNQVHGLPTHIRLF